MKENRNRIVVGIVGYGYWGTNLVRDFAELPSANLHTVCDFSEDNLEKVARLYPRLKLTQDYRDIIDNDEINAVVISTPASSHFQLALEALQAGKHVFVSKPMAMNTSEAHQLIAVAEQRSLTLLVDHVFVYTGAVQEIRELLVNRSLGDLYYYDSVRVNPGFYKHEQNVIWDLAVHDFAVMNYVLPHKPIAVSAVGKSHIEGRPENIAYITLHYEQNFIGHIHVNWMAPAKVRRTLIGGNHRMIVYDDLDPSEPVRVYDRGISQAMPSMNVHEMLSSHRIGDMWAPRISLRKALSVEVEHFVESIQTGQEPITSGQTGLEVVEMTEAATTSMKNGGELIELTCGRA